VWKAYEKWSYSIEINTVSGIIFFIGRLLRSLKDASAMWQPLIYSLITTGNSK
jgi:hypothetical protein